MTSVYDVSVLEAFSKVLQKLVPELPTLENLINLCLSACAAERVFLVDVFSKICVSSDSSPSDSQIYEVCCDMMDLTLDLCSIYGMRAGGGGCAFDSGSVASIRLNNNTVLYLKQVTEFLAVVCILRDESYERRGLIDYNIHCFRAAVQQVLEVGGVSSLHQSKPLPQVHRPH